MTETIRYPYQLVNSKSEILGTNENRMDLYSYRGELDADMLKRFCNEQKNKFISGTFYFLIVFDEKKNAVFPTDPFTAAYGTEEKPQRHIRASYTFNRLNGYSKLDYYEENKWESIAHSVDV